MERFEGWMYLETNKAASPLSSVRDAVAYYEAKTGKKPEAVRVHTTTAAQLDKDVDGIPILGVPNVMPRFYWAVGMVDKGGQDG